MSPEASFHDRIPAIAEAASEARATFDPPAEPPAEERAMEILREGAGPAVSLFVEARTGGHMTYFPPAEYRELESAMNDYLDLYAACYGVDLEGEFQLREAAELLVDTHNIRDTAQILTGVPERGSRSPARDP
jgi:hypothetical protein